MTLAASLYAYGSLLLTYATVGREFRERMALLERPGPRLGEAAHMLVDCLLALPGVRS